ncbi:UvrD-helicase domain-containing protein [Bacillus sp. PS06]|uniref:UvrD-helicase domain-containing protein n=1 Tax=Bacillus sp. PS06 TaxID=2764176 RepID=UPI00177CD027|nr:UvrD-helicase domain-containing protein [Bacillus sp. PS06]MBD8067913.1 UvrD-helicase domain-containing protein [Bacillus sp. PS06]
MTKLVVDQEARDKIKHILNLNFLVEAGAGSGKTTSLVERMVNLVKTGTCQIEEIVAITFTRKAADELKTRFQNELENTWKEEIDTDVRHRLEQAIQNMEQCFLGTVHSFCARLLRERPVEAKLDITFSELEDEDDDLIAKEAWHHYLTMLQMNDVSRLKQIRELGIDENTLLDRFQILKTYPDVDWVKSHIDKPELSDTYLAFINLLNEASRCIPEKIDKGPDNLQKVIKEALRMERLLKKNDQLCIKVFELFDKKSAFKITQKKWTSKEDSKEYQGRIEDFFEERISPLLVEWRQYCHPIIIEFLHGAYQVYEQIKQQRSLLNFQDLLINTTNLLRWNPEVRTYFQQKYKCLLVDEYQDTDPIQAEMLFYLTGEDVTEKDWSKCKPRAGSLFVVGDPKQAIYRFRRADIDIYNKVKELMKAHGGEVLQLTMNFRTIDSITMQLNDVFRLQLPETETKYQAAYRPLNSFKEDQENDVSRIKTLMVPAEFSKNQRMILEKDAENITLYLKSLLQKGHEPKEFMILTRYNGGMDVYANTLENAGIPISVSGELQIGTTMVWNDLLILLKTFVDITDSLATVATLRSIWFGISDEELFQWKQAGGSFSVFSKPPEEFNTQTHPISVALNTLRKYTKWVGEYSPFVAIEKITEDIGLYPLLIAKGYGNREYTQFLQLIEATRKQEDEGQTMYHQTVAFLAKMIDAKTKVVDLDEGANSVRILNVHKAKGLEAPIVFLAHPGKKTDISERISTHIKRDDQTSQGYFKFVEKNGFVSKTIAEPHGWENYKAEEEAYLLQEELRILYVAATRAEKEIIISSCQSKNNNNPWSILLDGLKDTEQISLDDIVIEEKNIPVEMITHDGFLKETANLLPSWIEESSIPSFTKLSPTDDKEEIYTLEIEREAGGGKDWGLVIHEILEKQINKQISDQDITLALNKHQISDNRLEEVRQLLQQFRSSAVWNEIQTAETVLTEVPFSLPVHEGDELFDQIYHQSNANTIYLTGIIDLVYKLNGQWKIVDYKTDRPKDVQLLPELTNYYRTQIELYKQVWEKMTSEKVQEAQLYFVTPNKIVTID